MTLPLVRSGAAAHRVDHVVPARFASLLPLGALTVSIVGSALLGGLIGAGAGNRLLKTSVAAGLIAVFVAASTTQWLCP
ncbi:hypothetical protein F3087_16030 [Nocardia colli]|uniref:Uncharacterized protein n=1 Tax=Nocardia colli TaxID=2545717 RepID=A0A5N0EHQ5_9NOCA|nr:hypothetical protein [Nocardia colli]KAA8888513.1 hypothetical protein F3087_16030 [Nocardia colli]